MGRGNPLIERMSREARRSSNPYAHQPTYYDQQHSTMQPAPGQQNQAGSAPSGSQDASPEELHRMYGAPSAGPEQTQRATINDVIVKSLILLGLVVAGGVLGWMLGGIAMLFGLIGFVLALVVIFKRKTSPGLIIAYAACQGVFLGGISAAFNAEYPGIVVTAIIGTISVFIGMLTLYAIVGVRLSKKFMGILAVGMISYTVFIIANLIFGMFTGSSMRDITIMGIPLGLIIGAIAVVMAAICLIADFQQIDHALKAGIPERESWQLAFGLMVTLIWLYVEILRLLSYVMNRD